MSIERCYHCFKTVDTDAGGEWIWDRVDKKDQIFCDNCVADIVYQGAVDVGQGKEAVHFGDDEFVIRAINAG